MSEESCTVRSTKGMGRFAAEFEVANNEDVIDARNGVLLPEKIRSARLRGVVDTGASNLVLPASVVSALGLPGGRPTVVQYADNRTAVRQVVQNVEVRLLDRSSIFYAIVEPDCPEPLIGAIVLEVLDLVVNSKTHQLEPRDPRMTISYI